MPGLVEKSLLNIDDVAKLTGLSVGTLYHWVSQRRIPFVRLSARRIMFRASDLEKWITEKVVPAWDSECSTATVGSKGRANSMRKEVDASD